MSLKYRYLTLSALFSLLGLGVVCAWPPSSGSYGLLALAVTWSLSAYCDEQHMLLAEMPSKLWKEMRNRGLFYALLSLLALCFLPNREDHPEILLTIPAFFVVALVADTLPRWIAQRLSKGTPDGSSGPTP